MFFKIKKVIIKNYFESFLPLLWSDLCQEVNLVLTNFFSASCFQSHLLLWQYLKRAWFNSFRHWPLCYSWIGYQQANGPPWVLLSYIVDYDYPYQQRGIAVNPNLTVITALFRYRQIFTCYLAEIMQFTAYFCLTALYIMGRWLSGA